MYNFSIAAEDSWARERDIFLISLILVFFLTAKGNGFYFILNYE